MYRYINERMVVISRGIFNDSNALRSDGKSVVAESVIRASTDSHDFTRMLKKTIGGLKNRLNRPIIPANGTMISDRLRTNPTGTSERKTTEKMSTA